MKYYTIDMEWNPETAQYQCGVLYHPVFNLMDSVSSFSFVEKVLNGLSDRNNVIFSHYGGGSDFLFLLRELVGRKDIYILENEFFEASGKIIAFSVIYKGKRFQFRDSYALLPVSLNELARSFLLREKIYDSEKLENLEMQQEQCFNDARLLWEVIYEFMSELELEELPLTYSTLAFNDMKKRCDFEKLDVQSANEYETFLPWFAGGHVDVYRRHGENISCYDIKSCYPAAQLKYGCPIGKIKESKRRNVGKAGLYYIKTNIKLYNPFLWSKQNGKLYFVNGDDYFLVTDIELDKIEELGFNYKVYKAYEWDLDVNFFKDFVNHWFEYKEMGGARRLIGKLMLNGGGYGKWAIKRDRTKIVFGHDADYFFTPDYDIGVKKIHKDFWYSQIHIASRITSGGRILLYEAQEKLDNKKLCYSDTDSVHCVDSIGNIQNTGLGKLELENFYNHGYWLGNKFYFLCNNNQSKCILKGFPEKFTEEHFKQALNGNLTFLYAKKRLMKMRSALRRSNEFVNMQTFLREVKTLEIKRKLNTDGITTEPYFLEKGELK
jgi:hypothetical protein